jgi:hypothetical protein
MGQSFCIDENVLFASQVLQVKTVSNHQSITPQHTAPLWS